MILRFFSFLSLLMMTLMGIGVARSFFKDTADVYIFVLVVFGVLCAAVYFFSASFPRLPWSKRQG